MTTIKYAASGEQRKKLVSALSEVLGCESKYLRAPSYGYEVGSCIVNRTGDIAVSYTHLDVYKRQSPMLFWLSLKRSFQIAGVSGVRMC